MQKTFIISAKEIDGQKLFDGAVRIDSDKDLVDPALRELLVIHLSAKLTRFGIHVKPEDLNENNWFNVEEDNENRENEISPETSDKPSEPNDGEIKYMETPYGDLGTRPPGSIRRY